MKKLLVAIIVLLVAVLAVQTRPDKTAHKEAMMKAVKEFIDEEADNQGLGDGVLSKLGKSVVAKTIETALNSKLKMDDYYVFNKTYVRLNGKDQMLSVGLFGKVITFDKEMLREKLEEALKAKEEAATEKEAAKQSARELRQLQKEQRKRERELQKEQKRQERAARKEQKRLEKEARKAEKKAKEEQE